MTIKLEQCSCAKTLNKMKFKGCRFKVSSLFYIFQCLRKRNPFFLTKKKEKEKYGTKNNEEKKVVKFCSKSIKKVQQNKKEKNQKEFKK